MTEEEFLNSIEGTVNDLNAGITTTGQCCNQLLKLFIEAHHPAIKTRDHFQLFIYRVKCLRDQQKKYDQGDYKAKVIAKRMEVQVDNAINTLVTELGYSIGDIVKKYEQSKLL